MRSFVEAYQASHAPAWLDAAVKYYDWCVGKMAVGPDGYKGWIGPADNGLWYDDHVGDPILVERMLEFSELVLKDPELKKKYGEAANRYVEIGKRDPIEKWDKRNTWREDGEYRAYVAHNKACEPEKLTEWKDVDVKKQTTRHWVGVHRYRNYQAEEIRQIAEAYHTGIVFTRLDIERIINTNLKVMWNGDQANPKWSNSDALLPKTVLTPAQKKAREEEENNNPYAKEGRAGTLWTALDDFSQTVRDLEALRGNVPARDSQAIVGRAYFQNVTLKTPPSLDRRYAKDAKVEQVPATDCPSLTVATVLPHILSARPSVVLCKSRLASDLEVAVYSADGKDEKCVLYKGKIGSGMNGQSDTLIFKAKDQGEFELAVPMREVTDVLVVE